MSVDAEDAALFMQLVLKTIDHCVADYSGFAVLFTTPCDEQDKTSGLSYKVTNITD